MGNSALMKGFDDPEVMAAVDDVAKHPENLQKYRGNPKASALLCCEFEAVLGGHLGCLLHGGLSERLLHEHAALCPLPCRSWHSTSR